MSVAEPGDQNADPVIRVLAADDQRVVREGLAMLLGLLPDVEVVGTAADGAEAVALAAVTGPDVVLMDLRMPRLDGAEATRRLRERCPDVRVIVLTTYADDQSVLDALRAGARGYLTKDAGAAEIHQALRDVTSGRAVIDPAVQGHLVDAIAAGPEAPSVPPGAPPGRAGPGAPSVPPEVPSGLTLREAEVLALIADGLSNAEIAERLVVSEATVKVTSITCWPRSAPAAGPRRSASPTGTGWPAPGNPATHC